jgi:hypothetical protein
MRVVFAAFASAVASTALLLLASAIFDPPAASYLVVGLPVVLAVTLAHSLLFGVPAMLALRSAHLLRWSTVLPTGFVVGALPTALGALARSGSSIAAEPSTWSGLLMLGGLGVVGAIAFWQVWLRLNDSRDRSDVQEAADR